ncbi:hypothetical protein conserved [Leishmania donovani]|uniref:Uncharacterized protein n=3 Tax=Leishmania donovani species complex TaxID=38574 RepID=A4HUM1_LEIIN|nr:conserved hypothetical protein [Leishmania infantum JPCM5]XP_003858952.1 hypothetical protein, conserved [Leishmania donovani]CAC9458754.1 hypothetical_protein_-_conserved [Leishmania infantum]AYU76741.1 hypothetical protein LdCL_100018700 [Leishmania donovani]TPP46559.1 hypothetical protein CGC21_23330 [Leishmania donovani]TPP52578.1 hypothetical protein CGC20_35570 [Leishmania donovani]CAJ1986797.1 hypothetical protein conserved [Leishmania donovani]|eukprot:XP_001463762.1 conserved hypothetical protein [Leishmania infantum JPCM5]
MQAVLTHIHKANVKALVLSRMNIAMVVLDGIAMLMLIVTWALSVKREQGGVLARYAAGIIGFVLLAITMMLSILVQRLQPRLSILYAHQVMAVLTLILSSLSMGMNDVVVDLCNRGKQVDKTQCGSHIAETIAEVIIALTMVFGFGSSQQRIVTFIDKGILDGIKGRSNAGGLTQLP